MTSTIHAFNSPSGKRRFPRVQGNLGLAILGKNGWEVQDLSLGGARLIRRSFDFDTTDLIREITHPIALILGNRNIGIFVRAKCRIVWTDTDKKSFYVLGIHFIDLKLHAAKAIESFIEGVLHNKLTLFQNNENLCPKKYLYCQTPNRKYQNIEYNIQRAFFQNKRVFFRWTAATAAAVLSIFIFIFASYFTVEAIFSLRAAYSAVTAKTSTLLAPTTGTVFWEPLVDSTPRNMISRGTTIGYISPYISPTVLSAIEPRIANLEAKLQTLIEEEKIVLEAIDAQKNRTRQLLNIVRHDISRIENEIAELLHIKQKLDELFSKNIVTLQRIEQISSLVSERRTQLFSLMLEERKLAAQELELESGRLVTDERAVVRSLEAVRRERASVTAELLAAQALLQKLKEPIPLKAQRDGLILEKIVDQGMVVEMSAPLLKFAVRDEESVRRVQALMPVQDVRSLRGGDPAVVRHGPTRTRFHGKIARIVYTPEIEIGFGLPSLRSLGYEAALVELDVTLPETVQFGEAIAVHFPALRRLVFRLCSYSDWPIKAHEYFCN